MIKRVLLIICLVLIQTILMAVWTAQKGLKWIEGKLIYAAIWLTLSNGGVDEDFIG